MWLAKRYLRLRSFAVFVFFSFSFSQLKQAETAINLSQILCMRLGNICSLRALVVLFSLICPWIFRNAPHLKLREPAALGDDEYWNWVKGLLRPQAPSRFFPNACARHFLCCSLAARPREREKSACETKWLVCILFSCSHRERFAKLIWSVPMSEQSCAHPMLRNRTCLP